MQSLWTSTPSDLKIHCHHIPLQHTFSCSQVVPFSPLGPYGPEAYKQEQRSSLGEDTLSVIVQTIEMCTEPMP